MKTVLFGLLLYVLVLPVVAQDAPVPGSDKARSDEPKSDKIVKKAPVRDELSTKLVSAFDKNSYSLAGVKKCTHRIKVTMSQMGQSMTADASFAWDGKEGKLTWDDPQMGAMFSQQIKAKKFSDVFKPGELARMLKQASLKAEATETGTVVTVDGETEHGFKKFHFGPDGVPVKATGTNTAMGQAMNYTIAFTYTKIDGKYAADTALIDVETGMGQMARSMKYFWAKSGDHHVLTKETTDVTVGGRQMGSIVIEYSDYKFGDAAVAPKKEAKPAATGGDK